MFIVVVQVLTSWEQEAKEYWTQLGPAVTAARLRFHKDHRVYRVLSWPALDEMWSTQYEPRIDAAALAREVFGGAAPEPTQPYEGGPDGY